MKKFDVTIVCSATYTGNIEVPDDATFEEAIELAREALPNIPLGELEYIPDSDELDEENCSFDESSSCCALSKREKMMQEQLNTFGMVMGNHGYAVSVLKTAPNLLASSRNIAFNSDLWSAYFVAEVVNDCEKMVVHVYDRGGNNELDGRFIATYTFVLGWDIDFVKHMVEVILERFGKYGKDLHMPESNW